MRYHTRRGIEHPDYQCMSASIQDGTARCQGAPGTGVDAAIATLVLDTLTPLTLEVALSAQAELAGRAAEADRLRASHVERARHRAENARRRYLSVDPDNRLAAASKPTGTTHSAASATPKTPTTGPSPPTPPSTTNSRPRSVPWPPTSHDCGPTPPPPDGNANG